ncbi:MAG: S-layer homology domain-containing protein, partial [Synergistales bacterium]|nr:S-layer homology domain-containing protein [Synergistales bacterium]
EIVKGCGDGLFHPGQTMTRAELCALLAQAMNCAPVTGKSAFADVPEHAWYAPYVNALWEMGLVEGCGDGQFHPLDMIDHEQFITVVARLAARLNMNFYELCQEGPVEDTLADESLAAYSDWAKSSAWLLGKSQLNLFGGEINLLFAPVSELDPTAATLREEAAALLYAVLSYTGILAV